jgi:hypothetical protein
MNIIGALQKEESKLQQQLTAVQGAIAALNGGSTAVASSGHTSSPNVKRTMSAAVRAKIARAAKARWAKIRTEEAKKAR